MENANSKENETLFLDMMLILSSKEDHKKLDQSNLLKLYSKLTDACALDGTTIADDLTCENEDFAEKIPTSLYSIQLIKRLSEALYHNSCTLQFDTNIIKNILVKCIIVLGQYHDSTSPWSSSDCSLCMQETISLLCNICKCSSLLDVLVGGSDDSKTYVGDKGFIKDVLQEFSYIFTKSTWKKSLPYINTYCWLLYTLKNPHLSEHLSYLLPPALFILDDWETKHKVIGTKALQHIILNTASSELRWHGRAEVIFDALHHQLYTREPELFSIIFSTLIPCSTAIENDPQHTGIFRKSHYDIILGHLLREMAYEQQLDRRAVYAQALKEIALSMGFHLIRWSKDLLKVCHDYLEINEGPEAQDRLKILCVLKVYSQTCWPRIHAHTEEILKMLFKMSYEISNDHSSIQKEVKSLLLKNSKEIVNLMYLCAPKTVSTSLSGFNNLNISTGPKEAILYIAEGVIK